MELKTKPKVAFFLSHPIQYISPLLKEMAKEFDLHVYYFSDNSIKGHIDKGFGQKIKWDVPLLEGYNYTFIKNYSLSKSLSNKLFDLINPGTIKFIFKDPSKIVIINGWSYFSDLLTLFIAKIKGKKVWLRAENPLSQEVNKNRVKIFIKTLFLKQFLFKFFIDRFLFIGKENKFFFKHYGANEKNLIFTPYSVDNSFFDTKYQEYKGQKEELKKQLNIPPGKTIVLFSGKYIEKKRPIDLLKAFHQLNNPECLLIMMGDGELRPRMEAYILNHSIDNVLLTGFINQSSISKYYAMADVFVMCSGFGETWGLSVNEAMNFSLPLIVSSTTGCSSDLVKHGENGFVFEEGNIDELSGYLKKLTEDKPFRLKSGERSKELIQNYSIQTIVKNMAIHATYQ